MKLLNLPSQINQQKNRINKKPVQKNELSLKEPA